MDLLFAHAVTISDSDVNEYGRIKLSALLRYGQEAADGHCKQLGFDWDTMAAKGLFWAVMRHRMVIDRLPEKGETITVQTWPVPATRTAYPRMIRAVDSQGNRLFEIHSLWTLMGIESRAMVLPGRSGVDVPGLVMENQIDPPGSLLPGNHENSALWIVSREDLDINGHVNNAKYLDHAEVLAGGYQEKMPREVSVSYLSECRLEQKISLNWTLDEAGVLTVDGCRRKTDVCDRTERVFALKIRY